jgi:hypothetical protein
MDYHAQDRGVAEEGMSSKGDLTKDAQHHAKDAAQSAQPWMERLARLGYASGGSSSRLSERSLSAQHSSMIRKRLVALAARCRYLLAKHLGPGCWGLWRSGWAPMDYLCSRWHATGT